MNHLKDRIGKMTENESERLTFMGLGDQSEHVVAGSNPLSGSREPNTIREYNQDESKQKVNQ